MLRTCSGISTKRSFWGGRTPDLFNEPTAQYRFPLGGITDDRSPRASGCGSAEPGGYFRGLTAALLLGRAHPLLEGCADLARLEFESYGPLVVLTRIRPVENRFSL